MQAKVYFAVLILSTLVIEGLFAVPVASSGCPPGLPQIYCYVDPCKVSKCPEDPTAKCFSIYCGGCNAIWLTSDGLAKCHKTCKCPPGQNEVQCIKNPCLGEKCPAFPDAKCVPNYCGGCNFDWFNKLGQKVDCKITI